MSQITMHENNLNASRSKRRLRNSLLSIAVVTMLSSCSSILGTDHSVCDLRVLALQIPTQSRDALKGSREVIDQLQKSQEKLKQVLPSVAKKLSDPRDAENILKDGDAISANIDLIVKNQKSLNHIYDTSIVVSETVPSIQAEYNLMVDQMARNNYPSTQVVIAKNQVFIAERILRSLTDIVSGSDMQTSSAEDFLSDVETFNTYLKAQLNGNPELGVTRISDTQLRESLESIKSDTDEILLNAALTLRKSAETFRVANAIKDNQEKSADIFNKLEKLE